MDSSRLEIPTFACVLRSGGDYTPMYAMNLYEGVKRNATSDFGFVCLTDFDPEIFKGTGILAVPLKKNYPGWWSVLELFRLKGPVVVTGLDTVITGDLNELLKAAQDCPHDEFTMFRPFNRNNKWASGFMVWNGDWRWIYERFDPAVDIDKFGGEQNFTVHQLLKEKINVTAVQDKVTGKFYSYKHTVRKIGLPDDALAVVFHGKPRPIEVTDEKWMPDYWRVTL